MYCIKCGVKLSDTEKMCPLCNTMVYHPELKQEDVMPLYPRKKLPQRIYHSKVVNVVVLFCFLMPLLVCLWADWQRNSSLNWFGYLAGAMILLYAMLALPGWFRKPNPVIFIPCDFIVLILYLLYINLKTSGNWFLSFALPVTGIFGIWVSVLVILTRYCKKGRLYIWGGAMIALGGFFMLVELFVTITFYKNFIGWSIYPMIVFLCLGLFFIYLAIDCVARERMERKFFF